MQIFILLRKVRDFGERISDTLLFLKQNWKKLLALYALFVIPFLILAAIFGADSFSNFFNKITSDTLSSPSEFFTASLLLAILMFVLATTSYATFVYAYMRLYESGNGEQPGIAEVGRLFFSKFLTNLGYAVLTVLLLFLGIFIVIIPILGILAYLAGICFLLVTMSLLFPVSTIEDNPFGSAFVRCFQLIRNRWWFTFGYVIILGIIFYFFSYVIQFMVMMVFGFSSVNFLDPSRGSNGFSKEFFLVLGLASILQQVFYLLVHVGLGVHYYSLAEEKDGSGLEQRLEHLGERTGPEKNIDEQY